MTSITMLIALFVVIIGVCTAQKVPVSVYYESLCPDSQAFISEQLYPAMKSPLGRFVDLKLIPYGKSNRSTIGSDVEFTCHHGPNECYGNKVHSCAIEHIQVNSFQNQYTRESLILEYVNCLMQLTRNFPDQLFPGKRCAEQFKLENWQVIEACANQTEGSKLLEKNGELTDTLKPSLTSVPTITFRHQQDESQALALVNFRSAVCKKMQSPLPVECTSLPNSAPVQSATTYLMGLSSLGLILALKI
ncbi:GILT-like protein 1 [Pseudolycoriella hygida]|uniref:GILT-like protein 1 n=1 Tax=Pseudolycoriella hygida TaxID=35572 RepID=A0A9Q0MZG3_9DIPT|nr:GILT-like protein 1 [Pseudolycoriella hygida]